MREWRNAAGYRVLLSVGSTADIYVYAPDARTPFVHRYDWWQRFEAVSDAEMLAEAIGAKEVSLVSALS